MGHFLVRRDSQPPRSYRTNYLPAVFTEAGRPPHPGRKQISPAQTPDGTPDFPRRRGRQRPPLRGPALVPFQKLRPGRDVYGCQRTRLPLPANPGRRRLHLCQTHGRRPFHHTHARPALKSGGPSRRRTHGRPRHQRRPL